VAGEQSSPPGEKGLLSTDERAVDELEAAETEPPTQTATAPEAIAVEEAERQPESSPGGADPSKAWSWIPLASGGAVLAAIVLAVAGWRRRNKA